MAPDTSKPQGRGYAEVVAAGGPVLVNGAIETRMRFGTPWAVPTPPRTVDDEPDPDRRRTLHALYAVYAVIAREFDLDVLLQAPTTSSSAWLGAPADVRSGLAAHDRAAVAAVRDVAARTVGSRVHVGAVVSPVTNPYDAADGTGRARAAVVHRDRARTFADAGVDLAVLAPWSHVDDVLVALEGVADAGLPAVVAWLLDADGDLLDGTPLAAAVRRVDDEAAVAPVHHGIQCVHPRRARRGLRRLAEEAPALLERVRSVRANAADVDVGELDESATLRADDPESWAADLADLRDLPDPGVDLPVLGGCCGTDERHALSLALRLARPAVT